MKKRIAALFSVGLCWAGLAMLPNAASAEIISVKPNAATVGKYDKLELSVELTDRYFNPYDPDEVDMSAEFVSPSKKSWKVNGFYDGTGWKVRFAAKEVGAWQYVVSVKDLNGVAKSPVQSFTCTDSKNHGWVRVAPNKRYLSYDDGTSFYGEGCCYAWSVTEANLDQMKALGFNTYVYWNGTYDQNGGGNLIESLTSGVGVYDQPKCKRIDALMEWNEARDMTMVLVILPHDYACENVGGTWPAKWSLNPYSGIVSSNNYYSDPMSWEFQQREYRYIIARWGYSRGLSAWQTVDEISGTNGYKANHDTANEWTAKMAAFFQNNDPFKHPTTASLGGYWDAGDKVNDLPNTEVYGNYSTGNIVRTVQQLWNNYDKPCIMGETGAESDGPTAHRKIWAGLAAGISITPLLWQYNQGWSPNISAQYPAFNKFIADINFAGLKDPAQAKLSIPGMPAQTMPATQPIANRGNAPAPAAAPAPGRGGATANAPTTTPAARAARGGGRAARGGRGRGGAQPMDNGVWGITSDQLTFGWMTGPLAGKNLVATDLKNGSYKIEWWDCDAGKTITTANVTVTDGTLNVAIPPTTQLDMAFKIVGPE